MIAFQGYVDAGPSAGLAWGMRLGRMCNKATKRLLLCGYGLYMAIVTGTAISAK
jgi:hypothetical protein